MIVDGVILARSIVAAMPRHGGPRSRLRAEVLALLVLLDARRVLSVAQIRDELGVPQATTSAWLDEAEADGWVARQREAHGMPREHRRRTMRNDNLDGRRHIVMLTAKGKQLLRRRRGTAQEPTP